MWSLCPGIQEVGCGCASENTLKLYWVSLSRSLGFWVSSLRWIHSSQTQNSPTCWFPNDLCWLGANGLVSQRNSVTEKCQDLDFSPWGRTAAAGVGLVIQQHQTQIQAQPTGMVSTVTGGWKTWTKERPLCHWIFIAYVFTVFDTVG